MNNAFAIGPYKKCRQVQHLASVYVYSACVCFIYGISHLGSLHQSYFAAMTNEVLSDMIVTNFTVHLLL